MRLTLSLRIILGFLAALIVACAVLLASFQIFLGNLLAGPKILDALLYGLGGVLLVALTGAAFIHKRLAPVRQCVLYAEAVSKGDKDAKLELYTTDCLGHLAQALRIMVAKLEGQAHWYESILNTLPQAISVTDMDMHWTFCNTASLKSMSKTSMEEVRGLHCSEKKGNICDTPQCGIEQLRLGNKTVINSMPNGKTMRIMLDYLYDAQGKAIGHVETGEDITEQIRLEQESREAAHKARAAMVQSLEGVVSTLSEAAEALTASLSDVRDKAGVAADRLAETATAMDEMNSTVLEVANNAEGAAGAATSVQDHAQEGAGLVRRTVENMTAVQQQSMDLKEGMGDLDKQARDIGRVLTLIRDVADQTNLLALNAAIEAARAGEAGRGFAVVADEVRKLAEKTMSATREVETAIAAIQQDTGQSASTVDNTVTSIEEVAQLAQESGQALELISSLAGDSSNRVSAIAAAATEQSAASEEINRNIADVNALSARIAEAMEQAEAQVREMADQVHVVSDILENIRADKG